MVKEYHLAADGIFTIAYIPGDKNKFVKIDDGYLISYGLNFWGQPYISIAQTIACKYPLFSKYVNHIKITKIENNTEKVLRMYIETTLKKYNKLMSKLKNDFEQKKLDEIMSDF